jgi:hypothetical protein
MNNDEQQLWIITDADSFDMQGLGGYQEADEWKKEFVDCFRGTKEEAREKLVDRASQKYQPANRTLRLWKCVDAVAVRVFVELDPTVNPNG